MCSYYCDYCYFRKAKLDPLCNVLVLDLTINQIKKEVHPRTQGSVSLAHAKPFKSVVRWGYDMAMALRFVE